MVDDDPDGPEHHPDDAGHSEPPDSVREEVARDGRGATSRVGRRRAELWLHDLLVWHRCRARGNLNLALGTPLAKYRSQASFAVRPRQSTIG
jgi:hypothetical protein